MNALSAHSFTFAGLMGGTVRLADYAGKTVLVANTASKCGFTPQYEGLQRLWTEWQDAGLVVIGVPCNDFGNQEPGSETEVQSFCASNFRVSFPMTAKVHVKGPSVHPFFRWINQQAGFLGRPRWNFYKYLINGQGEFVDWYSSMTIPMSPKLVAAVSRTLGRTTGE
jgi:glutathione peroxidase